MLKNKKVLIGLVVLLIAAFELFDDQAQARREDEDPGHRLRAAAASC